MKFDPVQDFDLLQKALKGDEEAAKMYCGSYTLVVHHNTNKFFRCKGDIPEGYYKANGIHIYDKYGFLHPTFWSLPRI